MAISKLILDGEVQMDVTQDTVTPNSLLYPHTATAANGEKITGNIETKTASDISISENTVTIPGGYYDKQQTASVASGSLSAPTASKGPVSNNRVDVTPSVTATSGYIRGGTVSGTPVTVTASDLVSGSQTITTNRTVDVTNLAEVVVNVPPNNQNKTVNPSLSQQIVTADSGYTGLGNVVVTAMPAGTEGTPMAIKGDVINNSITVTPTVENIEGYISGGTITGRSVDVSASELVSGSRTITTNQTVDVTNLAEVVVAVSDEDMINNQDKTVTPSTSVQTVEADAGYTGLGTVTVNAMPEGEEGTPVAETSTDQSNSIVITPKVTNSAGYISGGLRVGEPVTINPGVTSFNGETGDVTYTAPVTSVNGSTGAVTVSVPTKVSQLTNDSGYITSVPNGTTSTKGIVQLSDSVSSTSTSLAATANAVRSAYNHYPSSASTSTAGIVQLSDSVSSTSTSLAATANAVRSAYNHGGVTSVNNKTGAVSLTIPTIYVTEEGTSGSWNYRKWSNKTYECWATIHAVNGYVSSSWGSGDAVYTTFGQYSYPVTFKSAPFEIISSTRGTKTLFIANDGDKPNTTTKTAGYLAWRPTNAQVSISFYATFYVKGTLP